MATASIVVVEVDPEVRSGVRAIAERRGAGAIQASDAAVVARFDAATDAVRTAGELLRAGAHRGGVHAGEAGDADVAIARALHDAAAPGQLLVSAIVRLLVEPTAAVEFEPGDAHDVPVAALGTTVPAHAVRLDPAATSAPLRVVIAEDAAIIRAGLARLLADEGFEVVAQAADAEELLAAVAAAPPDLVVTDIRMPPTQTDEGLRAAASIRASHPEVAVLVLSQHVEPAAAAMLFEGAPAGVGYMLKERVSDVDEFVAACRAVAAGGTTVDPLVGEQLLARRDTDDGIARLSEREREVLGLMAQGRSNRAIAAQLVCSDKTVETHVRSIFTKLDLPEHADDHRRVAAVIRWLQAGR